MFVSLIFYLQGKKTSIENGAIEIKRQFKYMHYIQQEFLKFKIIKKIVK